MWSVSKTKSGPFYVVSGKYQDHSMGFLTEREEDAKWLVQILDAATDTTVRLVCHNDACVGKGGYITRTGADAAKNVYICDVCGKPLARGRVPEVGLVAPTQPSKVDAPAAESVKSDPETLESRVWALESVVFHDGLAGRIDSVRENQEKLSDRVDHLEGLEARLRVLELKLETP